MTTKSLALESIFFPNIRSYKITYFIILKVTSLKSDFIGRDLILIVLIR
jgi:hypothetical protein